MPGTFEPTNIYDDVVIELSGRSMNYPLDFTADVATGEVIPRGGVCTLNADGELVAGLGDSVANEAQDGIIPMPLFAIHASDSFITTTDLGNIAGGKTPVLVATGGYEIETTGFKTDTTYAPNQALTFGVGAERGKIVPSAAKYSDETVIGIVSGGTYKSEYNVDVLSFWSVLCPAVNATV
jgi:hypothetical protein